MPLAVSPKIGKTDVTSPALQLKKDDATAISEYSRFVHSVCCTLRRMVKETTYREDGVTHNLSIEPSSNPVTSLDGFCRYEALDLRQSNLR
nr:hypothetical protein [uncultured bacterium]